MSKVLIIRHLPTSLSLSDKETLLKQFGAENVWETKSKRNYVFASFPSAEIAKASLIRLHQLEVANKRLVVEYSYENKCKSIRKDVNKGSDISQHVKDFLRVLNAWNPSVKLFQPPPIHLKYRYPTITSQIVVNIIYNLLLHKPFYIQVLHLMNKMCLDTPFVENEMANISFKNMFRDFFINELNIPHPESESESELSSDGNHENEAVPKLVKRKNSLSIMRKRTAAILSTATLTKTKKTKLNQQEVFETTPIQLSKKISLVVPPDALQNQSDHVEVIGELGTFQKEETLNKLEEKAEEPEKPMITKKELLQNRISFSDMKVLPVFKNYQPGPPSMRLYIKNLVKTVTEQDLRRIYRRYVEDLNGEDQLGFDVRVMQEGRMKGQAFVTFPSVKLAEKALHETNGYLLKDKPMVVHFARAANKKSID